MMFSTLFQWDYLIIKIIHIRNNLMSIINPLQPINIFSNMLYSVLDMVNIAKIDVLNHIVLSLIKSIDEYKENLLNIESLVTLNPNIVQFNGYEAFYENFGNSSDDFENLLEIMEIHKDYSSEFQILYQKIDTTYTLLIQIIDTVSVQEALYLDKKVAS